MEANFVASNKYHKAQPRAFPLEVASYISSSQRAAATLKSTPYVHPIANQTAFRDHKPN
jgi:hypothetical protein